MTEADELRISVLLLAQDLGCRGVPSPAGKVAAKQTDEESIIYAYAILRKLTSITE